MRHHGDTASFRGLLVILALGCSDDGREQTGGANVNTLSTETVRVTHLGRSVWSHNNGWRLEEDLLLGERDGGGPEQFGQIAALIADSAGMIYVLDAISQQIRVFRPNGTFAHTIGRKGKGPGEFVGASAMAFGPGDTLWVVDDEARRYSAFDRNGRFLNSHTRQVDGPTAGAFLPDGDYIDWGLGFPEERPGVIAGARTLLHPIRMTEGFQPVRSLPGLEHTREMIPFGDMIIPTVYFVPRLVFAIGPRGDIWFASSQEYRLYRRTLEGDTTLALSLPAQPVPVGEAERAYVRARVSRPDLRPAYIESLPETKPLIHRILFSGSEHVLVIAEVATVPNRTPVDVFRRNGEFLGRLTIPHDFPILGPQGMVAFATADCLYVVVTDELGVPYVSRSKIVRY